jgi:hypothetical protein
MAFADSSEDPPNFMTIILNVLLDSPPENRKAGHASRLLI